MSDLLNTFTVSASGMRAQSARLRHLSENIANADTPGYRRKTIPFREVRDGLGAVETGRVALSRGDLAEVYDPGHPLADEQGIYKGSNVDLVIEIADSREAQRSYDANLKLFDQARQMSQGLLDLLRR